MGELTPQERLQPSLLDRLTDDDPQNPQESRERRVLSLRRLREIVLRDLAWLFNTPQLAASEDLSAYPEAANSVINYGVPELAGLLPSHLDTFELQTLFREAVLRFEPRILPKTLSVQVVASASQMNRNAVSFVIEGELWAQPIPLQLYLKTELDLDTGQISLQETKSGSAITPGGLKREEL